MESLESFIKTVKTARTDFVQQVVVPSKDGQSARTRNSSGTFSFERPGHFRFDYQKPFAQTIVADGKNLWLYDADLNQVTERKQAQALSSTPAALISTAQDLQSLEADFALSEGTPRDGLEWVMAIPKSKEGQLQSVSVGFRAGTLATLEIRDGFGQVSTMRFTNFKPNVQFVAKDFVFKAPEGADLVRQP